MRGVYSAAAALIFALASMPGIGAFAEDLSGLALKPAITDIFPRTPAAAATGTAPQTPSGALPPRGYGPFPLPAKMQSRVKFWVDIYSRYSSWEFAIHNVEHPEIVYSVIDTRGKPKGAMPTEKTRVLKVLAGLIPKAKQVREGKLGRDKLRPDELKIYAMFEEHGLLDFLPEAAQAKMIRGQAGLRDGMEDAIFISGRYLPRMEKVFDRFSLPSEIAYLPFVESGFNKRAISKVGASGIWQFMPYTGKLYLRVDDEVDERNDPMRAAEAAARLMKQNYDLLGEWPLAVTAYNHGAAGIARAVRESGSKELPDLIERYEGKSFGFASQNFYASFLAALHVAKNAAHFLGSVPRARKLEFDEFVMPHYMEAKTFMEKLGIEEMAFRELNPALTEEVYSGRRYMPVGYTVRIPTEIREDFFAKYEAIPGYLKFGEQKATPTQVTSAAAAAIATPEAAGLVLDK